MAGGEGRVNPCFGEQRGRFFLAKLSLKCILIIAG
jgi:hypothetical protein